MVTSDNRSLWVRDVSGLFHFSSISLVNILTLTSNPKLIYSRKTITLIFVLAMMVRSGQKKMQPWTGEFDR